MSTYQIMFTQIQAGITDPNIDITSLKEFLANLNTLRDAVFRTANKLGFWMTAAGTAIPFTQLEARHVHNILRSMRQKYINQAHQIAQFYASTPGPNGEYAQIAFEQEEDYWFEHGNTDAWEELIKQDPAYPPLYELAIRANNPWVATQFPPPNGWDFMQRTKP